MRSMLLVGFEHLLGAGNLGAGGEVEVLHATDLKAALPLIRNKAPELILFQTMAEESAPENVLHLVQGLVPDFRATIIIVVINRRGNELAIYEWDAAQAAFAGRCSSISCLKKEVQTVLRRNDEVKAAKERIRDIGHYDCVRRDTRTIHIQTEVIWRDAIMVQSTVIEGGEVHYTVATPYAGGYDDPQRMEQFVQRQHQGIVDEVNQGKHC